MLSFFNSAKENINDDKFVTEPLSEVESSSQLLVESGVTTVTFFSSPPFSSSGDDEFDKVATNLRERVRNILGANPWAAGKVIRNRNHKNLQLVYPKKISDEILDRILIISKIAANSIHSETPYDEMYSAIDKASAIIPSGKSCINKDILSTKITLVPHQESASFALIMSMSHTIADGYTYYRILSMLSESISIESTNARRKVEINPTQDAWSTDDWNFITTNVGFIANLVWGFLFGSKAKCFAFYTDDEKISSIKGEESQQEIVEYVSTNDILVSNHSMITRPRLQTIAINFRGRVPGAEKNDGGNYEAVLFLDEKSYNSASVVRQAVQNYERDATRTGRTADLPSTWKAWKSNPLLGQLSNWSSFFDEIQLGEEDSGWKQELHLPILNIRQIPFDCAVIFRPKANKTAIMYVCTSPQYQSAEFWQGNSPVGELVSSAIFCG